MADFAAVELDYGALVDSPWAPEPDRGERESLTIRSPIELLQRARAAAEAETEVRKQQKRPGVVTLNKMIVHALQRFLDEYEKANGSLPEPKKAAKAEPSRAMKEYATAVAKKRQAREN